MRTITTVLLAMLIVPLLFIVNTGAEKKSEPVQPIGADHREAPSINVDATADLADVYAFVNANNGKVVLAMTVNPFTVPGVPAAFSSEVLYEFKINNITDDKDPSAVKEDLVIQAMFTKLHAASATDPTLVQEFSIVGPEVVKKGGKTVSKLIKSKTAPITGPANATIVTSGNVDVFAGRRDDPFFMDFIFVTRLTGLAAGGPLTRAPGLDFFGGTNVSVLAIQLPASVLTAGGNMSNTIKVWGTTSRATATKRSTKADNKNGTSFVQIERTALPLINSVLIQDAELKDLFNKTAPATDAGDNFPFKTKTPLPSFKAKAIENLAKFSDTANATTLVGLLLPDVLTLDTTSTAGFATLNGRRPEDDVVDIELNLITKGAVKGDGVNANDKPFLTDFPFFAPENPASSAVPARN